MNEMTILQNIAPLLLAALLFQLIPVGLANVQSDICPINCKNRTCIDPSVNRYKCSYGCIDNTVYGNRCATQCPSPCVTCYRYFNQTRECYSCIDGRYITHSNKTCQLPCPKGCKTCSSSTNCTACKAGYTGDTCQNCVDGKYGVSCNLSCRTTCKSCTHFDRCIDCNDGYYNNIPVVTNCSLLPPSCPSTCTTCTSSIECTSCINGYYNTPSEKTCTNRCLQGCTACTFGTSCTSCKRNFKGKQCDECIQGSYGDNCDRNCPDHCVSCSSANVCQICEDGFYSIDCGQACPNRCVSCTDKTHCDTCTLNYKGTACEDCVDGRYGTYCTLLCLGKCLNNVCDRISGDCVDCLENFTGQTCNSCTTGQHGDKCDLQCPNNCLNNKCNRYTVDCSDGCTSNFTGSKCDICADGYYGINCFQICETNCYKCNRNSGICSQCKDNFDGNACEQCISGKYGDKCEHNCSAHCNQTDCNRYDGTCSTCKQGYYGTACQHTCSPNCQNKSCKQINGICFECKTGFSGDKCCLQNEYCDACVDNDECLTCVDGMYGKFCNFSCSHICKGERCVKDNGYCIDCNGNFYGPLCEKVCPTGCLDRSTGQSNCDTGNGHCTGECMDGYYGDMCNKTCNEFCRSNVCNKAGTICKLGCVSGRQGSLCTEELHDDTGDDDPPLAIIAGVCGAVAAPVLVVIVVILIRRRRNTKGINNHRGGATITSEDPHVVDTETDAAQKKPATPSRLIKQGVKEDEDEENDDAVDNPYYKNYDPKAEYGNIGDIRKIVSVAELEEYLKETTEDEFREQFKVFPAGLIKAHKEARKQGNISKNRYAGVYPYDENRVKLRGLSSDFINASYIDGHTKTRAYIASLGPTSAAMDDFRMFWHMMWQDKVEKIVVLTNLVENTNMKCEQYWPKPKLTETFGSVSVTNLNEDINAEYTVRIFSVKKGSDSRTVTQVHFTAWPDKGVPDNVTSIMEFHNKIRSLKHEMGGPILVHCSAGVGRTGTYIALDILTKEGEYKHQIDIFSCVMALRQQRVNMVQTPSQYIYLHKAVAHILVYDSKAVPASKFQEVTSATSDEDFRHKFEQLCATMEDMDSDEKESKRKSRNLSMFNRNGGDIPGSRHRPRLHKFQRIGDNDYINAVFIDGIFRQIDQTDSLGVTGFKERNRFIAAQTPLPDTVVDFIKLILQEECVCVVNLEPEALNVKRDAEISHVYCFQFNKWPGKTNTPTDPGDFIRLIKDVKDTASAFGKPIIVHCLSGAIKCGLFCAVHNAIEKVQSEQEVSISNIMRHIKHRRRAAFPNKDQMIFCYNAVSEYLKSFDTYSNFD